MAKHRCSCGHWATVHDDDLGHGTGCTDCGCGKTYQDALDDPGGGRADGGGSWMCRKPDHAYAGRQ